MKISSNVTNSNFMGTYKDITSLLAGAGYANTDNFSFSLIVDKDLLTPYFLDEFNDKQHLLDVEVPYLRNQYILINSDGYPIRNIAINTATTHKRIGILKILPDGRHYQVMWGFAQGSVPSKWLSIHLVAHNEMLKRDKAHRAIANVPSPYFQQLCYMNSDKNEFRFSHMLWDSLTELARLTPNGIGLVPMIQAPSKQANEVFGESFSKYNVVARDKQNYFIAGNSLDDLVRIAQSVERAATNAVTIGHATNPTNYVSREYFIDFQRAYNVSLNPEVLKYAPFEQDLNPVKKTSN